MDIFDGWVYCSMIPEVYRTSKELPTFVVSCTPTAVLRPATSFHANDVEKGPRDQPLAR